MPGYIEHDAAQQRAVVNARETDRDRAEIDRLSGPRAEKKTSDEVQRLLDLHQRTNVKRPTSTGAPKVGDNARVRHAHEILRGTTDV
jgi:hypothetical protein